MSSLHSSPDSLTLNLATDAATSAASNVQSLTLWLSPSDLLKLEQLSNQYNLTPEEFLRRKALGFRLPRFIGDTLLRLNKSLEGIEQQLVELNQNIYLPEVLQQNPVLERNLRQFSALIATARRLVLQGGS